MLVHELAGIGLSNGESEIFGLLVRQPAAHLRLCESEQEPANQVLAGRGQRAHGLDALFQKLVMVEPSYIEALAGYRSGG